MPSKPPFKTTVKIPIRFADVDSMGHVNNAKYLTYFEEARVAYFKKIPVLDFRNFEKTTRKSFILAEVSCQFKSPAALGETLAVSTGVTSTGRSSFVMEYEIVEESSGRLVATGRSVQVCFDYGEGKSIPLTQEIKDYFGIDNQPQDG